MNISIVSGTYNRLFSLQRMVESARHSFSNLYGLTHQFVLVDGGSQDGTQEWCKLQPDILLIEHGKLLGAVKAFNDGAYAASGEYVILANDDIEFVDESILLAYLYMQSHLDCGVGCFYQNRNGRDWHIEEMPCVIDSEQRTTPYGQVCIVPKWLGDRVGWWGDYLHTYGGDNELSSRVLELGFKVSPIIQQGKQARIADHELNDDLRKINNITGGKDPRAVKGHHPDSWAWGRKWKHFDLAGQPVGAIVRSMPLLDNPVKKRHRFMYLPIYEQGWQVQKEQKRGLREALAKVGLVYEYDYIEQFTKLGKQAMILDLQTKMRHIEPTVFLSQLHNGAQINSDDISLLRKMWPDTFFVNWNGDFWPDNLLSEDGLKLAKSFNLQLGINRDAIQQQRQSGVNTQYWQIGYEPDGVGFKPDTFCDVVFLASGYSAARQTLVSRLRKLSCTFHLYGPGWREGSQGVTIYDFKAGCKIYQGAKISIGDSQWPDTGFVSNRVFQALAAGGAALAHQWFKDMDKLGLVDGETCINWHTFEELETKIKYYLSHEDERKRIADNGQKMCLERHSFDVRVKELLEMITPVEKKETGWRW